MTGGRMIPWELGEAVGLVVMAADYALGTLRGDLTMEIEAHAQIAAAGGPEAVEAAATLVVLALERAPWAEVPPHG